MITSKQRAFLRGIANGRDTVLQVGKSGVTDSVVDEILLALERDEVVKIKVLENTFSDARSVCNEAVEKTGAEPVQVIGRKFVLYKQSKENKTIDLKNLKIVPKQDNDKKALAAKKALQKPFKQNTRYKKDDKRRFKSGAKQNYKKDR